MYAHSKLAPIIEDAAGRRVLVGGELFMQHFILAAPPGTPQASPVPHLCVQRQSHVPGGAAAAARMLSIAAAQVSLIGAIGDDQSGHMLVNHLVADTINVENIISDANAETRVVTSITATDAADGRHDVLQLTTAPDEHACDRDIERRVLAAADRAVTQADIIVTVAGDGPYTDRLVRHLSRLALRHDVRIASLTVEDVAYPHASRRETKPTSLNELLWLVCEVRDTGGQVVLTNGCFDLLHAGHVNYLRHAAELGDFFVLALNSDESVRRIKGPGRPILSEEDRATVLSGLACIDAIIVFSSENVCPLLDAVRPEIYVKGGDYTIDTINQTERRLVEGYGGRLIILPGQEGASTTSILRKIHDDDLR